jgi:TonB family protein
MKTFVGVALLGVTLGALPAYAMCGGMFIKEAPRKPVQQKETVVADAARARIVNKTSKVLLARDGDGTTVVMANDVQGDFEEFALVVPVPTVITADQVSVVEPQLFARLEQLTSPTLTEIYDPDPCPVPPSSGGSRFMEAKAVAPSVASVERHGPRASEYGVKVDAHYAVGEYDIAVLSGKDSSRLVEWLNLFGYGIPEAAGPMFKSYLAQGMHFFVARVKLQVQRATGSQFLRPLRVQYKTPKFMLPIRLGMLNADGPQELIIYAFSKLGRIETVNYRTQVLEGGGQVPVFVKDDFSGFYSSYFDEQTRKQGYTAVFSEFSGPLQRMGSEGFLLSASAPRPSSPAQITPGTPRVEGGLTALQVLEAVKARATQLDECYLPLLTKAPETAGTIEVMFTISGRGTVSQIAVAKSSVVQHSLETCLVSRLQSWVFAPPKAGLASVVMPFTFRPPVARAVPSGQVLGPEWANVLPYVSRLHLKYDREHFPEDLVLQETGDQSARRVQFSVRHPWLGRADQCSEARTYLASLPARFDQEAVTMATLTGQDVNAIRARQPQLPSLGAPMPAPAPTPAPAPAPPPPAESKPWWKRLFGN